MGHERMVQTLRNFDLFVSGFVDSKITVYDEDLGVVDLKEQVWVERRHLDEILAGARFYRVGWDEVQDDDIKIIIEITLSDHDLTRQILVYRTNGHNIPEPGLSKRESRVNTVESILKLIPSENGSLDISRESGYYSFEFPQDPPGRFD